MKKIVQFIQQTFQRAGKKTAVVAISGGIDSAVSCTLLCKALGSANVVPIFLPYGEQSIDDSQRLAQWNQIPVKNWHLINIQSAVEQVAQIRGLSIDKILTSDDWGGKLRQPQLDEQRLRVGNIMARVRMVMIYDVAREVNALVCGTENKSERYLGYFTRFGDGASDLEPIQHLYKTEVLELARHLELPRAIIDKKPSAELWPGQFDEGELGFSYTDADQVLKIIVDQQPALLKKLTNGKTSSLKAVGEEVRSYSSDLLDSATIAKVLLRVQANWFKQEVPYSLQDLTTNEW